MSFSAMQFEVVSTADRLPENSIKTVLASRGWQYAYILHDKDVDEIGNKKAAHYHVYINTGTCWKSDYIAKAFGVPENFVAKVKGRKADACAYLIHANASEKHQYDMSEVRTNFDVEKEINAAKSRKSDKLKLEEVYSLIDKGELREYNLVKYVGVDFYVKYKNKILSALEYRTKCLQLKGDREMDCIFMTGESGSGKTTYAKQTARNRGFDYYVSSGSNDILSDYGGQPCIILDDLRPSCLGLSDLLKMLDNNTASSVKSRYYNKYLQCKLIIITTTLNIDEFFRNVFADSPETAVQLKRRCVMLIKFDKDYMHIYRWSDKIRDYFPVSVNVPNPISDYVKNMTVDDCIRDSLRILGDVTDDVRKSIMSLKELPFDKDGFCSCLKEKLPFDI